MQCDAMLCDAMQCYPTVQAPTGAMHFVMVCFVIVWNDQCCEEVVLCYLWFVMLVCTHVTVCHVVVCYDMAWYVSDNMMSYIYILCYYYDVHFHHDGRCHVGKAVPIFEMSNGSWSTGASSSSTKALIAWSRFVNSSGRGERRRARPHRTPRKAS